MTMTIILITGSVLSAILLIATMIYLLQENLNKIRLDDIIDNEYRIGERLLIKSKIMPYTDWDNPDLTLRVSTSSVNGLDIFIKARCNIVDGYVIHPVMVVGYDIEPDGSRSYVVGNDLSVTYCGGTQRVLPKDVMRRLEDG